MNWIRYRRASGLLLLAVSLALLVWGFWPLPVQERSLVVSPADMLPAEASGNWSGSLEPRILHLEWPSVIRTGDLASIRLDFNPAGEKISVSQSSSIPLKASPVLAEARLELPGIPHMPPGQASQGFVPGRPVIFIWDLQPDRVSQFDGTVWLHLGFIPVAGGPPLRQVLSAQRIQIQVIDLLGLSGPWARALGAAGVVVGATLALDGALIWFWSHLEKRSGR